MPLLSKDSCVLHLDVDAFFASVEQRDNPRLRGQPVAVGTGVVASCSYEARPHGVQTGMRLAEARHRCRSLIVLPGEYPRYEQAARCILAICEEQTSQVEVAALDDLYLDLAFHDQPERVAALLQEQIRQEVRLSVSIGLGSNKLVAKVATKEVKQQRSAGGNATSSSPAKIMKVPAGCEQAYLAPWAVRVLPGVGPKIERRLDRLNVHQIGEVVAIPLPVLGSLFGLQGRTLHDQARGIDPRPVEPRRLPQTVSRRTSFDPPVSERPFLRAMLDYLMERAVTWLRFHDLAARGLAVVVRYGDYESVTGRFLLQRPTSKVQDLKEAAQDRFDRLYQRRLPLRLLGVELAPLVSPDRQPELFPEAAEERARCLATCVDVIRQRFGFTSVLTGSALLLAKRLERDRENFHLRTPCLTR